MQVVRKGLVVAVVVAAIVLVRIVAVSGRSVAQRPVVPAASSVHAPAHTPMRESSPRHIPHPVVVRHAVQTRHVAVAKPAVVGASIVVPRLGIHAPVYDRGVDSSGQLPIAHGYAVTHFLYSAGLGARGNYVVYGHDDIEGNIFANLGALQPGDHVYFHRGTHEYVYQVTGSQVVLPTAVSVLDPTRWASLTMISCTPYGIDSHRIVVRATLVGAR